MKALTLFSICFACLFYSNQLRAENSETQLDLVSLIGMDKKEASKVLKDYTKSSAFTKQNKYKLSENGNKLEVNASRNRLIISLTFSEITNTCIYIQLHYNRSRMVFQNSWSNDYPEELKPAEISNKKFFFNENIGLRSDYFVQLSESIVLRMYSEYDYDIKRKFYFIYDVLNCKECPNSFGGEEERFAFTELNRENDLKTIAFSNDTEYSSFTDPRDGSIYKTIAIGNQVWMAENLKYLPKVDVPKMYSPKVPLFYVYGYDGTSIEEAKATDSYATYGVLYNWSAATNDNDTSTVQGACPIGWHLPSVKEWEVLATNLDGPSIAGNKMKEEGTTHWVTAKDIGSNESGFTALPGGNRRFDKFYQLGEYGFWWTADEEQSNTAFSKRIQKDYPELFTSAEKKSEGYSIRCVKN